MNKIHSLALGAIAVLAAGAASANVTTIDFESVPGAVIGSTENHVGDGYGGLNWSDNANVLHRDHHPGSGYDHGAIGDWVLYSSYAQPIGFSALDQAQNFDFKGVYIASAWTAAETVVIKGFDNGVEKYSASITATNTAVDLPELFAFNWNGIDTVSFSGYTSHVAFDNLQIEFAAAVPEPGSLALVLAGLGVVGGIARRRKA